MLDPRPAPGVGAARRRILVAEDDDALRRLIELRLGLDATLEVTAVGDGQAVLEAFARDSFDLLICDIMMPRVSGLSVCRQLRAAGLSVPVILLSAQQRDDAVDAVIELGGIEFMNKPYDAATLRTRIAARLDEPEWRSAG